MTLGGRQKVMIRRAALALTVVLSGPLLAALFVASPAAASCAAPVGVPRAIRNAQLVFVGSVTELTNKGRWATFRIDEVWKGTPGGTAVDIHAGPEGERTFSSVDRTYQRGTRYLVMATDPKAGGYDSLYGSSSRFEDNACSGTRPYTAALSRYRPRPYAALPDIGNDVITARAGTNWARVLGIGGGVAIAAALVAWRPWRRRRPRSAG